MLQANKGMPFYHLCLDGCGAKWFSKTSIAKCPRCALPSETDVRELPPWLASSTPPPPALSQAKLFDDLDEPPPPPLPAHTGSVVTDLKKLVDAGRQYGCVLADPPWPYKKKVGRGACARHYPSMSLEQIIAQPVAKLLAPNAHVFCWATVAFLPDALKVLDAWQAPYKSQMVWVKPGIGTGNYWRLNHEVLLLGIRGKLVFRKRDCPSWLEHPRLSHSRKPEVFRRLMEDVSYGPFLELFGRRPVQGWDVWGDEVERHLF